MRNFEDEPGVANNHSHPMEEEDVFSCPTDNAEIHDAEVTRLFEDARDKLVKVEANTIKLKRQIVVDLAKSLEGKVPIDSICMEIINQLRGQVSASFIRQCLEEKYKQKTRVENARKQNLKVESKSDEKLATVTSLNQEDGENKKKVIMVDVDGRMSVQEEDESNDEQPSSTLRQTSTIKDGDCVVKATTSSQELEQPQKMQQALSETESKSHSPKDNDSNIVEHEDVPDVPSQMIAKDKTVLTKSSIYNNGSDDNNEHIMHFEFSLPYREISEQMRLLFRVIGNEGGVWFSGCIDKINGKVISSKIGRLSH